MGASPWCGVAAVAVGCDVCVLHAGIQHAGCSLAVLGGARALPDGFCAHLAGWVLLAWSLLASATSACP